MKISKLLITMVVIVLAFSPLAACAASNPGHSSGPESTIAPTQNGAGDDVQPMAFKPADSLKPAVSEALFGFSLDLFQRMAAADSGKNVFASPLSVWLALSMTYNGASGTTAEGMAKALHAAGISLDDLNRDNAGLMGVLTAADPKVKIAIANSIWMRDSFEQQVNADFLDRNKQYYAAGVKALDFSDAGAAGIINKWVEDRTNGNIKDLVEPPIHPDAVMFLINAVHFKAPWKQAFDSKKTTDGVFTTAQGAEVPVKYLHREEGNRGFADDALIAARIPYASGRLEMVAILPQQQSLADYIQALTPEKLNEVIGKCGDTPLTLSFPKFKLEYELELNDVLKAMGMEEAFGDADFSAMSQSMGKNLVISKVKHKSFIEVNEEGTEASAATSVEMRVTGMLMSLEFSRPFLYLIRDSKTGAILFMGAMENPA